MPIVPVYDEPANRSASVRRTRRWIERISFEGKAGYNPFMLALCDPS